MKSLLIFPPTCQPNSPQLSIPALIGQLKKEGFNAESLDLNVEFYHDLLQKSYLNKTIKNLTKIHLETSIEAKKHDIINKKVEDYPIEIQELLLKDKEINEYLKSNSTVIKTIPKIVKKAVSNIKNHKEFYNPESFIDAYKTIQIALKIASLPYAPSNISFNGYSNPLFEKNFESIKYNVFSKSTNIFIDYFERWIPIIQKKKPDYIGISISLDSQIIAGLTLANLLKKHTNAHINIGGNYFSEVIEQVCKFPEFFDLFANSISIDEGERPIVELAKYIDNKISIDEVPNLIYKQNNKIVRNKKCIPLKLNEIPAPSLDGLDLSKYLTPEIVLPIQTTKGCYWGNCTFCDIPSEKRYEAKDVDKLVNEMKEYKRKYGITNFCFADDATHPTYIEKVSEKIIENNLNISYYCPTRTEKSLTKEILQKASQSGLKMILWGVESGSEKILKLMNKGIDVENRMEILRESSKLKIWNHAFIFFGFPQETPKEAQKTIDMFAKNSDILNSYSIGTFSLKRNSIIGKNPEQYGIKNVSVKEKEFSNKIDFELEGMTQEEVNTIMQNWFEADKNIYGGALWKYCNCYQYLYLYASHYGADWVRRYKFNNSR